MHSLYRTFIYPVAVVFFLLAIPGAYAKSVAAFTTSFNPLRSQTDHDSCTGASGRNLCRDAKEGDRVIALFRDLLAYFGGHFRWHDKVRLRSNVPQCNGVFSVEDTMHRRFSKRADLFFLDRSKNTSCVATLQKVTY